MQIALVKYDLASKDIYMEVADNVQAKDNIVIETTRGLLLAKVSRLISDKVELEPDTKYVRVATDSDISKAERLRDKAREQKSEIMEIVSKHNKDMKVVGLEYTLDESKIIISFVCEDRVDFRDLVKDLASILKVRIELRQIGVRDQARNVGCLGICGKECCCKQYLNDFDKVSIKMAKSQNLSLNPTKISGTCGRLMCCLAFENDTYVELGKNCPRVNSKVSTPDGDATVVNCNILRQTVTCRVEKGDDVKYMEYPADKVRQRKDKK